MQTFCLNFRLETTLKIEASWASEMLSTYNITCCHYLKAHTPKAESYESTKTYIMYPSSYLYLMLRILCAIILDVHKQQYKIKESTIIQNHLNTNKIVTKWLTLIYEHDKLMMVEWLPLYINDKIAKCVPSFLGHMSTIADLIISWKGCQKQCQLLSNILHLVALYCSILLNCFQKELIAVLLPHMALKKLLV
jgi:hypothetical protein